MLSLTNSINCIVGQGNDSEVYLAWNDMNWNIIGDIKIYKESKKNLCQPSDGTTTFFFTGDV